jgi:hypothetical protein
LPGLLLRAIAELSWVKKFQIRHVKDEILRQLKTPRHFQSAGELHQNHFSALPR